MKIVVETKGHAENTKIFFNGKEQKLLEFSLTFHEGKGLKAQICEPRDGRKFFHTLFNEDFRMYDKFNPENLTQEEN